jgi:hypothetical protein
MTLTEEQIKQGLREKIKQLEKQIGACKTALLAFGDNSVSIKQESLSFEPSITVETIVANRERKTVRSRVEGLLADSQCPMISREIMDAINKLYNKSYTFNNFSGNFSQTYRKPNSKIKQYEIADAPIELKFVYGLKSWADGEELKHEYLQRFLDKHL